MPAQRSLFAIEYNGHSLNTHTAHTLPTQTWRVLSCQIRPQAAATATQLVAASHPRLPAHMPSHPQPHQSLTNCSRGLAALSAAVPIAQQTTLAPSQNVQDVSAAIGAPMPTHGVAPGHNTRQAEGRGLSKCSLDTAWQSTHLKNPKTLRRPSTLGPSAASSSTCGPDLILNLWSPRPPHFTGAALALAAAAFAHTFASSLRGLALALARLPARLTLLARPCACGCACVCARPPASLCCLGLALAVALARAPGAEV